MIESLVIQSVSNTFIREGSLLETVQFKSIERSLRRNEENLNIGKNERIKLTDLEKCLQSGLVVCLNGLTYVTEFGPEKKLSGGAVKKLSRVIDIKTESPKTTRGTVYRRNSTVIERRCQNPNWRTGDTAKLEERRKRDIFLTSYEEWRLKQEQKETDTNKQRRQEIKDKKNTRQIKRMIEAEWAKRVKESSPTEKIIDQFIQLLYELTESRGIANEYKMRKNLKENMDRQKDQPLIVLWGPPYEGQVNSRYNNFTSGQPEGEMALWIEEVLLRLKTTGLKIKPILIYADIYGNINGIPEQDIDAYEIELQERFKGTLELLSWSQIIEQNNRRYKAIRSEYEQKGVKISDEEINRALNIQRKLGKIVSKQDAIVLAQKYKLERLIEGQILTEGFFYNGRRIDGPIKMGTASSKIRNDDPYEGGLARFYIKNMPRAAWSKPRKTI